jgi:hypothetical protein
MPNAAAFMDDVCRNPVNRRLLDRLPRLDLPNQWLVAGCLFQTIWNLRSGLSPAFGIQDYDVFYFNDADLSWEAENEDILRAQAAMRDLNVQVELKNQARVHLWYGERFGPGYPKLERTQDGIDRFLSGCTRVGVRTNPKNELELYAPDGLDDLYNGILRPNPLNYRPELFLAKAESYKKRWPWLTIIPPL